MNKAKLNANERALVEGLEGLLSDLRADAPIEKKYTCRRVVLDLHLHKYSPEMVKQTRKLLNASQSLFAQFLGVKVTTVRSWESGASISDMACRFMDEIRRNPGYWKKRLGESIKVKTVKS